MALDEYWVGITRYIPAQHSSVMNLVGVEDVKSPLQLLPMHLVAQAALALGVDSPYWQYRSVIIVLAIVNLVLIVLALLRFAYLYQLKAQQVSFLIYMLVFYFAAPFALTRPMFESVAAPWLALAAVQACYYDINGKIKDLLLGVFFISICFVLRQQLGFCALIFILLPFLKKQWKHLVSACILGGIFFIVSGIPDYFIRGEFHFSLLNLTVYNFEHGSDYGDRTILFYPILIFVITLMPFFIKKYPIGFLKEQFLKQRSLYIIVFLFIFLHSLFPQKWERFAISLIPIFIMIGFPFLRHLHENFNNNRLRLLSLHVFNGALFFVASFFPAQKNLIEMSRYLDRHPEVYEVYRVADTPGWITEAFILDKKFNFIESNLSDLRKVNWSDCGRQLVIGEAQQLDYVEITEKLIKKAEFSVNFIEQLAFKMNPKNNLRRVKLSIYSGCQ